MEERALRSMIAEVKTGRMSRRHFVQAMVGLGLTAPMAAQMLAAAGVAQAQPKVAYKPTKRGGGGALKTLWWQGATLLNPHFATGTKDQDGSRIFYEPLASWDPGRQPLAHPRRRDPDRAERRHRQGRQVGDLEAQEGRGLARRQAVHRRRCASSTGSTWPTPRRPRPISAATRTSRSTRSTATPIRIVVPAADAVLGGRLLRRARHDHPQAPLRGVQGRQVPRGAQQSEAGGHRAVQVRGLQARRHGARRAESDLPHAQSPVLRHHRDEGRRRRGLGRPGRHPDGRGRLRLEHAGRGRDPEAHGAGRQGQGRHRRRRQHRAHPAQQHRSVERGRRRALQPQDQASVPDRSRRPAGPDPAGGPRRRSGADLRAHRPSPPRTS